MLLFSEMTQKRVLVVQWLLFWCSVWHGHELYMDVKPYITHTKRTFYVNTCTYEMLFVLTFVSMKCFLKFLC